MPTSFQIKPRWGGILSVTLSLAVLALIAVSWPRPELPKKPLLVKKLKPVTVQPVVRPEKSQAVTLPPPPRVKKIVKKIRASLQPLKPAPVKPTRPAALKPPPKPRQPVVAVKINQSKTETRRMVEKGRTLLRLLEHGAGPSVEFAWPDNAAERSTLYHLLVQCHGMRVALLDRRDQLFVQGSPPGEKWQINLDRYSAFMRQISGRSVAPERREIAQIRQRQGGAAMPVRIFTRRMDAYVLGSLGQILGPGYRARKYIHARYEVAGQTILVTGIVADGVVKKGRIAVPCRRQT